MLSRPCFVQRRMTRGRRSRVLGSTGFPPLAATSAERKLWETAQRPASTVKSGDDANSKDSGTTRGHLERRALKSATPCKVPRPKVEKNVDHSSEVAP